MQAYQRYGPALLRKAERLLQSRADAQDVVQAVFTELWAKGEESPDLPYLYRAVTNRCLNALRDGQNRQRILATHDEDLRGPGRTPCEGEVIGMDLLVKLVDRLGPREAEVLVLRYVDDLTQEELASVLGTSRKTVGKRLDVIRAEVRALLAEAGETGGGR